MSSAIRTSLANGSVLAAEPERLQDISHAELVVLIEKRRAELDAEPSMLVKGKRHLEIGLLLEAIGGARADEAIEELRQALVLLPHEEAPREHADVRLALGRTLLDRVTRRAVAEPLKSRAQIEGAAYHLESAYQMFGDARQPASRLRAARLWSEALARLGQFDRAYDLLERACAESEGELRVWADLFLAEHALGDLDPARRAQGEALLLSYFDRGSDVPEGTQEIVIALLGMIGTQIGPSLQQRAAAWIELQPDAPRLVVIALRASVSEGSSVLTPEDKAVLSAAMEDEAATLAERAEAASVLTWALPEAEHALARRATTLLETWLDAPDIHPLQRDVYRHDLGVAMLKRGEGDPSLLERAARHLEAALMRFKHGSSASAVARNLAAALLRLLELRADVSSPALVSLIEPIEALTNGLSFSQARDLRLASANALVRWGPLSHPSCVEKAGVLIGSVLGDAPEDGAAHRMRYLHAWIRHEQGLLDGKKLQQILALACTHGDVHVLEPLSDEQRAVARCLADNGALEGAELSPFIAAIPIRPDAAERLLAEIERRLDAPKASVDDRQELLEQAIKVAMMPATGDEEKVAARVTNFFAKCLPYIAPTVLRRLGSLARGPVGEAVHAWFAEVGIAEDTPADPAAARAEEQLADLHRTGIELMDKGQRRALDLDTTAARSLFQRAMSTLDQARTQARNMPFAQRAQIHISAGNARRHLARLDKGHAGKLLAESEAIYREAWPWTERQPHLRAQLAKVLADGLIQRYRSQRWAEAMQLYQQALKDRPGGFWRTETLWSIADAELACASRPRAASLVAALGHLDEALEIAAGDTEKKMPIAQKMVSLIQELAASEAASREEILRLATRVSTAVPKLADEAVLAAMGIGIATFLGAKGGGLAPELRTAISSGFIRAFSEVADAISAPMSERTASTPLRNLVRRAIAQGKLEDVDRRYDVAFAWAAVERSRKSAPKESAEQRAGRFTGRARVLSHLVLLGEDALAELDRAVQEAEVAIRAIKNPGLRGFALAELAKVFQQESSRARDFVRGAKMLEDALALFPRDWQFLRTETLGNLARATRFREDLPPAVAIELAITRYAQTIELHKKIGNAEGLAICLQNLSEALAAREDRPRVVAWQDALAAQRMAVHIAQPLGNELFGKQAGNLAYVLTRYAMAVGTSTKLGEDCLAEAGKHFEIAKQLVHDPGIIHAIRINYQTYLSARTSSSGDRTAVRANLREQVQGFDPRVQPFYWSMAAHNLAEEIFDHFQGADDLREALKLYRNALALRPIETETHYHWESAVRLGELLAKLHGMRHQINLASFGLTLSQARAEATAYLRSAMLAGKALGSGGSLVRAARFLGLLAADVDPGEAPDLELANEALSLLETVLALFPEDRSVGEVESEIATAVTGALARHRVRSAHGEVVTATGANALHSEAAEEVLRWMLRARGGQHRRLRARFSRPEGVSPEVWTQWRLSLRRRDNWDERRQAAKAVQSACPSFLAKEPTLDDTRAWIEQTQGAAAMLLETHAGWLLGALSKGEGETTVRASVVLLPRAAPTMKLPELVRTMRAPVEAPSKLDEARAAVDALVQWFRSHLLPELRAQIPAETKALLWSPHGVAAGLPLGLVWDEHVLIWTTPCLTLPPRHQGPSKTESALLVFADPTDADGETLPGGALAVATMASALSPHIKRIAVLLGRGRDVGREVLDADVPGLLPHTAPTPDEVRQRMAEHSLIVILAHGSYVDAAPEKSAIALLSDGQTVPLSAEMLAEVPDLLHGARVLLLSCETGTAGELSAAPEGLAGVLLAVGAAAVVAPLWPVLVRDGLQVGVGIVKELAAGKELGEAVQSTVRSLRARTRAGKDIEALYGLVPFVAWVG